ncbi:preprotein translocase subunit YajC [Parafrankia elaeagni]|uniref:preprotein translocase subunit YajC n=1 Tax=Parafrankia elaeagni TaxID=222534 RepID=UPI00037CFCF9|nr:preprotein translocase subunit YajC [Parafrankia elaeagni]
MQELAILTSAADNDGGSSISGLIFPLLIVLLIVYFFSTQRRRAKAQQQQLSQIVPGTLVVTTAGLYATVVEQDGSDVLLEIAPDVVCRFGRNAIARVISTPDSESDTADGDHAAPAGTTHGDASRAADGSDATDETGTTGTAGSTGPASDSGTAGTAGTAGSTGDDPRPDGDTEGTGGNSNPPRKEL